MLFSRLLPRFTPALLALFIVACGGGGSESSDSASTESSTSTASSIQGKVVKGVVKNATVTAFRVESGLVGSVLTSTTTNSQGQYNLRFSNYEGPVYIEVTPIGNSTQMVCDAASGCGEFIGLTDLDSNNNGLIDFGESFQVPADFILTAALPNSTSASNVNVSTLTHLAAQLATSYPQGINDVSISVAQSQLENLFQITDLANAPLVDLSNPTAVADSTDNALRHALISSSLLGLTNEVAFAQVLEQLVQQFQTNAGQLVTQDSSSNIPTLLDLTEEAQRTAQLLNLSGLAAALAQEASALLNSASGTLTNSQPSPTAGGSNAAVIAAFMDDLSLWQGYLSLSPNDTSFAQIVSAIGVSTGADLAQLLKAVSIAGQFGPVVALPDAALSAACDSLGNYFARLTCRVLISGKSLEEICNGTLNLVIFGRSLCDLLNDITLPLGNGLTGNFALYDGVARIYGTTEGVDLDITFTSSSNRQSSYGFSISGTAESEIGFLEITDGSFQLEFDGGLDIRNLKLPETASGTLSVAYQQDINTVDAPTSFVGDLSIALDLSGVTELDDEQELPYAGLETIELRMTADGTFESFGGDRFEGSIDLNGGIDSDIVLQFETDLPDYSDRAVITLTSTPSLLAEGQLQDIQMEWAGKRYDIMYFFAPYRGVRITNQDGVIMDLDLGVEDGDNAGYLLLDGTSYGNVAPLNGSLLFTLSNGEEFVL